ncbi:MAG: CvpA family protein [Roseburia sp.]
MNWVLIIVLLVLAISVWRGYHRGFLRIVYSLVSWLIVLAVVTWSTPHINRFLLENTSIHEKVAAHYEEAVRLSMQEQTQEKLTGGQEQVTNLGMQLPQSVMEGILNKTSGMADEFLEESGIYTEIADGIAGFVVQGIAFFIGLIAAWILVQILSQLLGIVSHIPILKGINRFLGLFAGGIYGVLLVWVGFYIIAVCSTGEIGSQLVTYINESRFLTFMYENNLVLALLLKVF